MWPLILGLVAVPFVGMALLALNAKGQPPTRRKSGGHIAAFAGLAACIVVAAVLVASITPVGCACGTPLSGSLAYLASESAPEHGAVAFRVAMTTPEDPHVADLHVVLVDGDDNRVEEFGHYWVHLYSDGSHIRTGDRLIVCLEGALTDGYRVVLAVDGYSGTVECRVPSPYWVPYEPPDYQEPPEYQAPPPVEYTPGVPSFSSGPSSSPG